MYPEEPKPIGPVYHAEPARAALNVTHTTEEAWALQPIERTLGRAILTVLGETLKAVARIIDPPR